MGQGVGMEEYDEELNIILDEEYTRNGDGGS